ncbi:MAG: FtsX-like permease family protein, partial [Acidobacteria bacterium]|nr:FtsX-like permease family protein [Acidobacteriota bacterium]
GQSQDNQVYIALSTHMKQFGSRRGIGILVRPVGGVPGVADAQDEVRVILRSRRHTAFRDPDPFAFVTAEMVQAVWRQISAGAFAVMILISGISLVVGGIVIMNIMLVSVIERTQEIGVRRAMGARSRDIQRQFLTEAVMLSLGGGAVGALLGAMIGKGISMVFPLPTLVSPGLIATGLAVALVTGTLAGWFPARRAANMRPVEALRFE